MNETTIKQIKERIFDDGEIDFELLASEFKCSVSFVEKIADGLL